MEYRFRDIEIKWQEWWTRNKVYQVPNPSPAGDGSQRPKCYVLDMFPYPSGAGLHVGHPLGYIASDIYSRYKRLKGFNVLHPMGYDAFGLPAEQYAIDHGIHPAVSTATNIATFRGQLDKIGFSFDWERQVSTAEPSFYKWTQWIFLQIFDSYYDRHSQKAKRISELIKEFEKEGNRNHPCPGDSNLQFSAAEWKQFAEKQRMEVLMQYRLTYCGYGEVNWCEALGTVLANDEVINGVSERGGHPVVKKKLRQWYLRITEYADRLLEGLEKVQFSEAMKEMQSNWIGKSTGAEITFKASPPASPPTPLLAERGAEEKERGFYQTAQKGNWGILKEFGRTNRKTATEAEDILWQRIRNNKLGVKVRRQHTVDGYIVDFLISEVNLVIEIDGGYHNTENQKQFDEARTQYLNAYGLDVIRFINEEVIGNLESVILQIQKAIEEQRKKTPLSGRRGVGGEAETTGERNVGGEAETTGERNAGGEAETPEEKKALAETSSSSNQEIIVYTTRPDTIFGVDFMVIAPEHQLVDKITTDTQRTAVAEYLHYVESRSERERMAEKKISGVFSGAYVNHPFEDRKIPVWISEYVLAGYGTGAIMAVPCGDERDHKFATHFNIPITNIIGDHYNGSEANATKDAILQNSAFLNGMIMRDAIDVAVSKIEESGIGKRKINYKMRDAAFSRQRYWGEPFPIKWIDGTAYPLDETELPLLLPEVETYKPGPDGEGPLANLPDWYEKKVKIAGTSQDGSKGKLETNTMPGYAGSSWYFFRYMDPHNDQNFCERHLSDYWGQVDLYIGGTEHAVGHLLYSRMWTKVLCDLGYIGFDEPYKKLVNQGMIQGSSRFVYRLELHEDPGFTFFLSKGIVDKINEPATLEMINRHLEDLPGRIVYKEKTDHKISVIHVDVNLVDGVELDINGFKSWRNEEFSDARFILEDGTLDGDEGAGSVYICGVEVEKMSKSKFNTVNPDDLVVKYGADTFRMYEMFLGPVEMSKPWDTKGIEGVHRFLKKFWRLFFDEEKGWKVKEESATPEEMKVLHKAIKKIEDDTDKFSFNTAVSAFMIATNELGELKCHKREVLEPLVLLLAPYAPHISEELYNQLKDHFNKNNTYTSIFDASYPAYDEKYLVESSKEYPVSVNGKLRTTMLLSLDAVQPDIEKLVLENEIIRKWLEGKNPKKIIFIKNKMINVVV